MFVVQIYLICNKWANTTKESGICYVIDLFSKYVWAVSQKDKKGITIVNPFQSVLDSSKRKPSKIWVDQGSEFNNSPFKNGS